MDKKSFVGTTSYVNHKVCTQKGLKSFSKASMIIIVGLNCFATILNYE